MVVHDVSTNASRKLIVRKIRKENRNNILILDQTTVNCQLKIRCHRVQGSGDFSMNEMTSDCLDMSINSHVRS